MVLHLLLSAVGMLHSQPLPHENAGMAGLAQAIGPERLAALRPGLKVLYISGYSRGNAIPRSGLRSGNVFLQKPFTAELLARKTSRD